MVPRTGRRIEVNKTKSLILLAGHSKAASKAKGADATADLCITNRFLPSPSVLLLQMEPSSFWKERIWGAKFRVERRPEVCAAAGKL